MIPTPLEPWLPTAAAARHLGVSPGTLKRWANPSYSGHCLEEGDHFQRGPLPNSPTRWHVPAIQQVIKERALQNRPTSFPAPRAAAATPDPMEVVIA